ncbi:MAG: hypothetical protein ACFB3T_00645 [Geminicoccaceae bacterium]
MAITRTVAAAAMLATATLAVAPAAQAACIANIVINNQTDGDFHSGLWWSKKPGKNWRMISDAAEASVNLFSFGYADLGTNCVIARNSQGTCRVHFVSRKKKASIQVKVKGDIQWHEDGILQNKFYGNQSMTFETCNQTHNITIGDNVPSAKELMDEFIRGIFN